MSEAPDVKGYHIIRRIGAGGMAEIFLARHRSVEGFQRQLVIKRILPELSEDPDFVESFLNEARLSAQLTHSNIVQIYDLGRTDNCYFIAMEYVRGFDLSDVLLHLRKGERLMPFSVAFSIMRDVCMGLDYAHNCTDLDGHPLGIVHRDVTPSNVIISMEGQAKLLDFGIAKATAQGPGKTREGSIKGKFSYIAPELLQGHPIDHRADIFSAGVTLFEMCAGRRPFRGETDFAILRTIVNEDAPPIGSLRPDAPPGLQDLLSRAMSRDLGSRFQTCAQFALAIEAVAKEANIPIGIGEVRAFLEDERMALEELVARLRNTERENVLVSSDMSGQVLHSAGIDPADQRANTPFIIEQQSDLFPQEETQSPSSGRVWVVLASLLFLAVSATAVWTQRARIWPAPQAAKAEAKVSTCEVTSQPGGASVYWDGTLLSGETPLLVISPEIGVHRVEVRKQGYISAQSEISVTGEEAHKVRLVLAPVPAPQPVQKPSQPDPTSQSVVLKPPPKPPARPAGSGSVRFAAKPWATISIDGKAMGDTPAGPFSLSAGTHTVVFANSDLRRKVSKRITVTAGQSQLITQDFMEK